MHKYLLVLVIPMSVMASSESSEQTVNERRRSHAGRTLSIINGNPDFGINTTEIRELFLRRQQEHDKLHTDFLAAAQAGGDLTEFLKAEHLNVNVHNPDDGMTALMYVAKQGRLSLVETLMSRNAKTFIKDHSNLCALDHATGHGDIRRYMLQNQSKALSRRNSMKQPALVIHLEKNEQDEEKKD